jgi:Family of unknown function (DUF6084)
MPELDFSVEGAEPVKFAATPQLAFKLRIEQTAAQNALIQAIALRSQIRIEPTRRRYDEEAQNRLVDLFGLPERWSQTLRSMLWTHTSLVVPPFTGSIVVDLPVPCSYDFNLGATRYFDALADGEIPLCLLFSGTIFYQSDDQGLQVEQISWEKEANFRLRADVWRAMMDHYYPNSAWLCLHRDVFDSLAAFKGRMGIPTWDQAVDILLEAERESQALK